MNNKGLKSSFGLALVMLGLGATAAEPSPIVTVEIDPAQEIGPVKLMNAVNGGPIVAPVLGDQKRGNFEAWKALKIPYGRTHDAIYCVAGGPHTCDISAVFPDFDADENDPKSYDFVFTDHYLDNMRRAGTAPFFRLGQTIEHGPKKYGVLPPKDFAKWARVAEHIIRHYNEGWAWAKDQAYTTKNIVWSNQFNVVYWEIWNEPDLDPSENPKALPSGPRCWGGTTTNFFEFYEIAAKHLKANFPQIKIGGPALAYNESWGERFLQWCQDRKVPLDFYSWHVYAREPKSIFDKCVRMRQALDRHGFAKTESILNEWNYVKGWTDDWVYSLEAERGRFNQKGAAFIAATMVDCQYAPLDLLMYYDARSVGMNAIFDITTAWPMKGYYPYYAWLKLLDRGTQVEVRLNETRGKKSTAATGGAITSAIKVTNGGFRAVAAKGANGKLAVFVVRYSDDNNVTEDSTVVLRLPKADFANARCHITDSIRSHTEVPLRLRGEGVAELTLQPNSFALIELGAQL